jgi:hypothetical protein
MDTGFRSTEPCTLAAGYNYMLLRRSQRCLAISLSEFIEKVGGTEIYFYQAFHVC